MSDQAARHEDFLHFQLLNLIVVLYRNDITILILGFETYQGPT